MCVWCLRSVLCMCRGVIYECDAFLARVACVWCMCTGVLHVCHAHYVCLLRVVFVVCVVHVQGCASRM